MNIKLYLFGALWLGLAIGILELRAWRRRRQWRSEGDSPFLVRKHTPATKSKRAA